MGKRRGVNFGGAISEGRAPGAPKLKAESRKQKAEIINAEGGDRFQFSKFQLSAFDLSELQIGMFSGTIQPMNDRIEVNPRVCGGRPVVKGTRIPVEVILGQLAEAESWDSILNGYPELTRADIQTVLRPGRVRWIRTAICPNKA